MRAKGQLLSVSIGLLALVALLLPGQFSASVQALAGGFLRYFDWWALLLASAALLFCGVLLFHPVGRFVIGGPDQKPEFRTTTWIAMMFAAGMGAGMVFWGAAEPLIHVLNPPPGEGLEPGSEAARLRGLALTQFHWSLHAWAIYAVASIAIAVGAGDPRVLLPSKALPFLPQLARRAVDILALVAVLFGLVASLGQGAFQVSAGLSKLTAGAVEAKGATQISFLAVLTIAYLASAWLGLRKGIAVLSNINLALAGVLAAFIFIAGPTWEIIKTTFESLWAYLAALPELSVNMRPEGEGREWTRAWSLVYLLWWVAWTPFVGVFLARISRGRTLRGFVIAAVLVPCAVTLVWFSVFGGAALSVQASGIDLGVSDFDTAPLAAYVLLDNFPFSAFMQAITVLLVSIFLITSADSGAYVMAMFSEEASNPSRFGRLFWGVILAALSAAAILSAEGQNATRALAVAGSIPLTFLLAAQGVSAAWSLFRQHREASDEG